MAKKATKTEEKQFTPFTIEGTINYKIIIDDEGYYIESERSIQNDLACIMLSKDIAEKFITDYKIRKNLVKGKDKENVLVRHRKLVEASSGITIMSTDILLTILAKASKI